MTYQVLGTFSTYKTEPIGNGLAQVFYRNEQGQDFYDLLPDHDENHAYLVADADGLICGATSDLSSLCPTGFTVIKSTDITEAFYNMDAHEMRQWLWDGTTIVKNQYTEDEIVSFDVRALRDKKLKREVDPIVSNPLRWADMTTEQQNAWAQYRTALLNITDQAGFPHNVTWPEKPE